MLVLMSLVVAGCVTAGQYQAGLDDLWTGADEAALVEQFGPPAEVIADGVVDRYMVRGLGGCPMPESQ